MENSCRITKVPEAKALPVKDQQQIHINNIMDNLIIVFLSQVVKLHIIENGKEWQPQTQQGN
jgi:hypothetical protein